MAQGSIKKATTGLGSKSKKPASTALTRRGSRIIAPKKAKIVRRRELTKAHSSGLNAMTERNLAEKAGHLEMLVGGKKGKKERDKLRDGERRVVRTGSKKGKIEMPEKKEIKSGEVVV
ncbi:hypothetical protein E6O75_ATG06809 [Venturia nashicola]|uniref:Uncharacterized protein n=1 Tax=Venturia nashicola TaxID=86259 RepID=A0A4Z1PDT9_9PEZI|nr:hypothetical protein E6O75_ATG06809 [Venturia nashicola]